MEIVFIDEDLAILYEGGKVKRKELKSNPQLQKQFGKVIDKLKSLEKIEDAFIFNALNYEKLSGNLKNRFFSWHNEYSLKLFTIIEEFFIRSNILSIQFFLKIS